MRRNAPAVSDLPLGIAKKLDNGGLNSSTISTFSPKNYSTPAIQSTNSVWKTNFSRPQILPEKTPAAQKGAAARMADSVFSPLTEDDSTPPPAVGGHLNEILYKKTSSEPTNPRVDAPGLHKFVAPLYTAAMDARILKSTEKFSKHGILKEKPVVNSSNKLFCNNVTTKADGLPFAEKFSSDFGKTDQICVDRFTQTEATQCSSCGHGSAEPSRVPPLANDRGDSPAPTNHSRTGVLQPDYVRPIIEENFEELNDKIKRNFYGFFSQALRHFEAQTEKMDAVLQQKRLVEKLAEENERLKSLVAHLEALRYGK